MKSGQFKVVSDYQPAGDQPQAIEKLVEGIESGLAAQTLLGVTGSGKTYTIANVIEQIQVRNQVEALKYETDLAITNFRAVVVVEAADILAVEHVGAGAKGFEHARDVKKGCFARTGRAGNSDELTITYIDTEIAQGVCLDEVSAVDLTDILHA